MSQKKARAARQIAAKFAHRFDEAFAKQRPPLTKRILGWFFPPVLSRWRERTAKANEAYKARCLAYMADMALREMRGKPGR